MPKISALGSGTPSINHLIVYVDTDDISMAPSGTTKQSQISNIPVNNFYNSDGTVDANRVVTMNGKVVEFREGTALMAIDGVGFGLAIGQTSVAVSAILDISSTTNGVMIPRMNTTERDAITVGAAQNSLLIHNTQTDQYEWYQHSTTSWIALGSGSGGDGIYGGDGSISAGETNVTLGNNTLSYDFNSTLATDEGKIVFKDANGGTEWARIRLLETTFEHHVQFSSTAVETENRGALLQLRSTTQALLLMRMTTTERNNIPTPTAGMIIFNTTTNQTEQYVTTTGWTGMGGAGDGDGIYDGSGTVPGSTVATLTDTINFTGGLFGVNIAAPLAKFHVKGDATGTGATVFKAESSTVGDSLIVELDGNVVVGASAAHKFFANGRSYIGNTVTIGSTSTTSSVGMRVIDDGVMSSLASFTADTHGTVFEQNTGGNAIFGNAIGGGVPLVGNTILTVQNGVNIAEAHIFQCVDASNTMVFQCSDDNRVTVGAATTHASALFGITSTTKGFLPPVMTGAQVEAITAPTAGLMAYATDAGAVDVTGSGWWGYDGTNWVQLG